MYICNMNYEEELKDVRWLKRRVDILIKRNFTCEICGGTYNLQIHHKKYHKSCRPWEYDDDDLVCLCQNCHELQHEKKELKLKGNYLLLPLYYLEEDNSFMLHNVGNIFYSDNPFPEQHQYLMISKRGCTEQYINKRVSNHNIGRVCLTSINGIYFTICPQPFHADIGAPHDSSLCYIWDNDETDTSYVEFTKLPDFEYDIAVISIDENGVSGWHRGQVDELFTNLHLL